jgi:hypothetical protein
LENLSKIIKKVLGLSLQDKIIKLCGFQENNGHNLKLINNSLFIDVD